MPPISLVVCVYKEGDLLQRLLQHMAGNYDDLVVVHDGPDTTQVRAIVERAGGRFFAGGREYQQEPHWPFAWGLARHDWILRLDADEFPSPELHRWLHDFRQQPDPPPEVSGYTCIWPLWDGTRAVSRVWPAGRNFFFDRRRVRFFGMVEQVPVADGHYLPLSLVLEHQPRRKSYGLYNVVARRQAWHWRDRIAHSLLGPPTGLNCWRWPQEAWPPEWEQIRQRPWRTAVYRLTVNVLRGMRDQWRQEGKVFPFAALANPVHHALICVRYWQLRRQGAKPYPPTQATSVGK